MSIRWHAILGVRPPQKTCLWVTGPTHWSGHIRKFICAAYYDEDFRPSGDGPTRWLDEAGDALTDRGWRPTHWALPDTLP